MRLSTAGALIITQDEKAKYAGSLPTVYYFCFSWNRSAFYILYEPVKNTYLVKYLNTYSVPRILNMKQSLIIKEF